MRQTRSPDPDHLHGDAAPPQGTALQTALF